MPPKCTVCLHAERATIDLALAAPDVSMRGLAALHGLSKDALRRHREHLSDQLLLAQQAASVAQADDLMAQVQAIHQRTLAILAQAERSRALGVALGAIREARGNLELLAKLEGRLREQQTINIFMLPAWIEVRAVIVRALQDHPAALSTLYAALSEVAD